MPATQQPQASVLARGDSGGEDAFRQPGRPAMYGSFRAENLSLHLSDQQEEDNDQNKQDSHNVLSPDQYRLRMLAH